jgi:O-antigen/teichoic acid export membrane protein
MHVLPKAVSNFVYTFLNWTSISALGYVFWVVLAKITTADNVGIFSTISNIALLIVLFTTLSMNYVLPKLVTEYQASNAQEKIRSTNFWVFMLTAGLTATAMVAVGLLTPYITSTGYLSASEVTLLIGLTFALFLLCISEVFLYAAQNMKRIFMTNFVAYTGRVAAVAVMFFAGFSFHWFIGGIIAVFVAISIYRFRWIPLGRGPVEKHKLLHYTPTAVLSNISGISLNQCGIIILSFLSTMADVGLFTIAFMFSMFVRAIPQVITMATMPVCSEAYACKQTESVRNLISYSLKLAYTASLPIAITFVLFSKEFLLLFATPEYANGYLLMQVLIISFLIHGISGIFLNVLYYIDKLKAYRNISVTSGLLNVVLCIALIPSFGISGAAAAFLISASYILLTGLYYSRKYLAFPLNPRSIGKNLVASAAFAAILMVSKSYGDSIPLIVVSIAAASIAYAALLATMRYFDEIDVKILKEIREKKPELNFLINPILRIIERIAYVR